MSSFFVTGTDTNVGKTVTSRAIIQAMQNANVQVVGYKPVACSEEESVYPEQKVANDDMNDYSSEDHPDVLVLMNSTNETVSYREVNSYTFSQNYVPIMTRPNGVSIDLSKLNHDLDRLNSKYQAVLVEGCFGWLTPLNQEYTFANWVQQRKMPTVLVVGIKEGCINHALLSVQSIQNMNVPLLGWVANRINPGLSHYAEIIETLKQKIDAPLLGEIPYIHHPEKQDLSRFITNSERLMYMKTELVK
ncbi:dethiobiotin synthase [Cricetibacter osteomyelitidis]|uniref:ATP-dependent dethiobiotin synthetase BioD n=1 Tax=Cricetibacter osteomyelitidis TaxID=1521931 RepID=A0A4R2SU12_9PAST|nr:dethiobiotin synthase [Cricetibacter osteomyelitidis]TCP92231.1 dethiobiotin synthase [Cricetibacter osteomyelitidis]